MKIRIELDIENTYKFTEEEITRRVMRILEHGKAHEAFQSDGLDIITVFVASVNWLGDVTRPGKSSYGYEGQDAKDRIESIRLDVAKIMKRITTATDFADRAVSLDERTVVEEFMTLAWPLKGTLNGSDLELLAKVQMSFPFKVKMYAMVTSRNVPVKETVVCSGHNHSRKEVVKDYAFINKGIRPDMDDPLPESWTEFTGVPGLNCVFCGINTFGKRG